MGIPAQQPDQERRGEGIASADSVADFGGDSGLGHRLIG
jgi:hypothetical protein